MASINKALAPRYVLYEKLSRMSGVPPVSGVDEKQAEICAGL